MAATTVPGDYRPRAVRDPRYRDASALADRQAFIGRWVKVWVALAAVVVLVVVVYLIFIGSALSNINSGLAVAQRAVTGAGGHTKTLPGQIQGINSSLSGINQALLAIPGQGNQIVSNLTSIEGHLTSIDGSLKSTSPMLSTIASTLTGTSGTLGNTSSSLVSTSSALGGITSNLNGISSSLVDTSGVLQAVLGTANQINSTLVAANEPAGMCNAPETDSTYTPPPGTSPGAYSCGTNQLGVQNIHQRVAIADNVLAPAQSDLTNIIARLSNTATGVDGHLKNICDSTAVALLNGGAKC